MRNVYSNQMATNLGIKCPGHFKKQKQTAFANFKPQILRTDMLRVNLH